MTPMPRFFGEWLDGLSDGQVTELLDWLSGDKERNPARILSAADAIRERLLMRQEECPW